MQPNSSSSSRRQFLGVASGTLASLLMARDSHVQAKDAQPRATFAFSLYGMRQLKIEDALRHCSEIGYKAIELAAMKDWPADPSQLDSARRAQLREQLSSSNLQLTAIMENLPLTVSDEVFREHSGRLQNAMQLGHELSPDNPPIIETILGGKPGQWMELRQKFVERLSNWAELAEKGKTIVCVKAHRFGAMNLPSEAAWLNQQVNSPWIQLAYDFSHFQHRDIPMRESIQAMSPHIKFVHIKDTVMDGDKARFVLPGEGGVNYVELFSALRDSGYRGSICVEVSGIVQNQPGYDGVVAAKRSYAAVAPAFQQVFG